MSGLWQEPTTLVEGKLAGHQGDRRRNGRAGARQDRHSEPGVVGFRNGRTSCRADQQGDRERRHRCLGKGIPDRSSSTRDCAAWQRTGRDERLPARLGERLDPHETRPSSCGSQVRISTTSCRRHAEIESQAPASRTRIRKPTVSRLWAEHGRSRGVRQEGFRPVEPTPQSARRSVRMILRAFPGSTEA